MLNSSISLQTSTAANALRYKSCKPCLGKNLKEKRMTRVQAITFQLLVASLALCSCFAARTFAQTRSPSPTPDTTVKQEQSDPFAPETALPLPPGMTGSDANDPRAHLKPGIFDAGEAAMGIKHLFLLKKPDAFQLGSDNPDNPKVQ